MIAISYLSNQNSEQSAPQNVPQWSSGAELKKARLRVGLTQAKFGMLLGGAAESSVRAWENGKRVPRWDRDKRKKVAKLLSIEIKEVNGWFEQKID